MSKTIWVVEHGTYSDYRVLGVFTSEANARLIADTVNNTDSTEKATVAEWPLNPSVKQLRSGLNAYRITMDRDGNVENCCVAAGEYKSSFSVLHRTRTALYVGKKKTNAVIATVFAKDDKHAIKIVNEKRIQFLASGELT